MLNFWNLHLDAADPDLRQLRRAGMRRARLGGRRIGRKPLEVDRQAILRDRSRGMSLGELATLHRISRTRESAA